MTKYFLKTTTPVFLAGLITLGALLRFTHIAKSSIWHDEGFTMMLAPMGPLEIISRTARDVHPPFYYLALHYWIALFGTSEVAARSLSAICTIAIIPLAYLLVRRLFNESAARVAALIVTLGPFLVRYGQEARMYGMVALLLLAATYAFVRALDSNRWLWWSLYAILMAAALYTHYYSVFVIAVHWLYVGLRTQRGEGLLNFKWWLGNLAIAALFIPWLPVAYAQFSRVQSAFWIAKVNAQTLPNTLLQFLSYSNGDILSVLTKLVLAVGLMTVIAVTFWRLKAKRSSIALLAALSFFAPLAVFILSFKRPIYVDRYFVFAAVGFYMLTAVLIVNGWPLAKRRLAQTLTLGLLVGLLGFGIRNVYLQSNHQMRAIGAIVNERFEPGDEILSGEIYTFFDFSYYNHTGTQLKLWSKRGVNGFGESSLIYDRQDEIVIRDLSEIEPASGYVWVIGKTGSHPYYDDVPTNWHPAGPHYQAGYSAAQKYQVLPRRPERLELQ